MNVDAVFDRCMRGAAPQSRSASWRRYPRDHRRLRAFGRPRGNARGPQPLHASGGSSPHSAAEAPATLAAGKPARAGAGSASSNACGGPGNRRRQQPMQPRRAVPHHGHAGPRSHRHTHTGTIHSGTRALTRTGTRAPRTHTGTLTPDHTHTLPHGPTADAPCPTAAARSFSEAPTRGDGSAKGCGARSHPCEDSHSDPISPPARSARETAQPWPLIFWGGT